MKSSWSIRRCPSTGRAADVPLCGQVIVALLLPVWETLIVPDVCNTPTDAGDVTFTDPLSELLLRVTVLPEAGMTAAKLRRSVDW